MSRIIPGARKLANARLPSIATPSVSRRGCWIACAFALLASCTLATDPFDPRPVDSAGGGTGKVSNGPVDVPGGSGGAGARPGKNEGGKGAEPVVPLDPVDPKGNSGSAGDAGSGEAGSDAGDGAEPEIPDTGSVVPPPDASEPPPDPCPGSTFASSCYEFFAEPLSWDAAEAACAARGGHLASVQSPEEDTFLAVWPVVLGIPAGDGSGIWLGGTDAALENEFRWTDGTLVTVDGWAPDQPNNGAGVDCIEKRNDGTARWYDQRCTDLEPYVCEKPL